MKGSSFVCRSYRAWIDLLAQIYKQVAPNGAWRLLGKAASGVSFHKVGIANVNPSIQIDIRFEVGAVSSLSGARFGLISIPDVGPFIFVDIAGENVDLEWLACVALKPPTVALTPKAGQHHLGKTSVGSA